MFQIGPREIGADLAFGVDLALFILQCGSKVEFHFKKDSKSFVFGKMAMHYNISQPSGEF